MPFRPHFSTCFIDFAEQYGSRASISRSCSRRWAFLISSIYLFHRSCGAILARRQAYVGAGAASVVYWPNYRSVWCSWAWGGQAYLIHLTVLLIPQSSLAWGQEHVGATGTRCGSLAYSIDQFDLVWLECKRTVGAAAADRISPSHLFTCFIDSAELLGCRLPVRFGGLMYQWVWRGLVRGKARHRRDFIAVGWFLWIGRYGLVIVGLLWWLGRCGSFAVAWSLYVGWVCRYGSVAVGSLLWVRSWGLVAAGLSLWVNWSLWFGRCGSVAVG